AKRLTPLGVAQPRQPLTRPPDIGGVQSLEQVRVPAFELELHVGARHPLDEAVPLELVDIAPLWTETAGIAKTGAEVLDGVPEHGTRRRAACEIERVVVVFEVCAVQHHHQYE